MQKSNRYQRLPKVLLPFALIVLLFFPIVNVVAEGRSGDNVVVEQNETLEETSFLSGENVRIDGDINGTTFITGGNIELNGTITGDLFVAGQNLTINGTVLGSVFLIGQSLNLDGEVTNNLYSVGQRSNINSQIAGSIFIVGQNTTIEDNAVIERDAFIGANTVQHNGLVNGDFQSSSDSLTVRGTIAGDLNYSSLNQADFLNNSEVRGETSWKKIEMTSTEDTAEFLSAAFLTRILWSLGAALIVWFFVQWLRPNFWQQLVDEITINPYKTLGFGAVSVILIPILSLLLMFTVIGIPFSFILLALYGVALYSSKIILAVYLSRFLQDQFNGSNTQTFWWFLLSLTLLVGLRAVPFVGMILGFVTVSLGVGAIIFTLKDRPTLA